MFKAVEFIYILTMFICVAAFSVHMTVKIKNLTSASSLAKQDSTTAYLLVVLITDLCDFMLIYLNRTYSSVDTGWLYVIENVLEVILIYTVIRMEGEYFKKKIPRALETIFAVVCLVLIYLDGIMDWDSIRNENLYFGLMILVNAIPIGLLLALTIAFRFRSQVDYDYKPNAAYLISMNVFCVFLCVVCTMSNADQQTRQQFVMHSKEIYEIIWLIFNILTFAFVWRTITPQDDNPGNREKSLDERIAEAASLWGLSQREQEMARLLCLGKNNKEMAQELFLSTNTVKVHLSNLYHKIGAGNRVQAVRILMGEDPNMIL